jgi:hypothetical protein
MRRQSRGGGDAKHVFLRKKSRSALSVGSCVAMFADSERKIYFPTQMRGKHTYLDHNMVLGGETFFILMNFSLVSIKQQSVSSPGRTMPRDGLGMRPRSEGLCRCGCEQTEGKKGGKNPANPSYMSPRAWRGRTERNHFSPLLRAATLVSEAGALTPRGDAESPIVSIEQTLVTIM